MTRTLTPEITQCIHSASGEVPITILKSFNNKLMTKTFSIGPSSELVVKPYDSEVHFKHSTYSVSNIAGLANLITNQAKSKKAILIRGLPKSSLQPVTMRNKENFPESEDGCPFVMLDFDQLPLPEGVDPLSKDAIEYAICKLPHEFHDVTYFFQFSSSAGILGYDGKPIKPGLSAHVFFWLSKPVPGFQLAAYLQDHCIQTGFYERTIDRGGQPMIRYGIDQSVIKSSIQPHYIAHPNILDGVRCIISAQQRQDLIKKKRHNVEITNFTENLVQKSIEAHRALREQYAQELGFKRIRKMTKAASGGVAVGSYLSHPNENAHAGRNLVKKELGKFKNSNSQDIERLRLYFYGESSPGSWYVIRPQPTIAMRYGDSSSMPLRELSTAAYEYIRDELKWFSDIAHSTLELKEDGYLPDIDLFATARNSLILAPTGSGKTTAFCRYVAANKNKTIIYAAQTIALTNQMVDDLRNAKITVTHYSEWTKYDELNRGVYVTTNESLKKFIDAAEVEGRSYELVIDEAHTALDDFMQSNRKNQLLEKAVCRAEKSIFMTATITPLQIKKLVETVSSACGDITPEKYACYEFMPVRRNPLWWGNSRRFGGDFVAMLRNYAAMKGNGEQIPRTIIIAPTSRMQTFKLLLEQFDLINNAHVVSRSESSHEEIEEARISDKPILISSPLFALGLNFVHAPLRFWTYFTNLSVDTSQIIQTLNRANRGNSLCEVRIYAGELNTEPFKIPIEVIERKKIDGYFQEESSFDGFLDSHFQIDRTTYLQLRQYEKHTGKSFYQLKTDNAVQNFQIIEDWQCPFLATKDDEEAFKAATTIARSMYDFDVIEHAEKYANETISFLLYRIIKLQEEAKIATLNGGCRVPKEFEDEIHGIISVVIRCIDNPSHSKRVKPARILRLFGAIRPYLSAQYDPERTDSWRAAAAEKEEYIALLWTALDELRSGKLNGVAFAIKMRGKLRRSVLALVGSDRDYLHWQNQLAKLDELSQEYKYRASKDKRAEINDDMFKIAMDFLKTIGVTFLPVDNAAPRGKLDPNQPVVPKWNFEAMKRTLQRNAVSLKWMPAKPIDRNEEDLRWQKPWVNREICSTCAHCNDDTICAIGRPIQPWWDDIEPITDACDAFKKTPEKLRCKVTRNPEFTTLAESNEIVNSTPILVQRVKKNTLGNLAPV